MKTALKNIKDFLGYAFNEKLVMLSLLGYVMILTSPLFSWYSSALTYTGVNEEYKFNMFQLSAEQVKEKVYIAFGIFIILIAVGLIAIEYGDYRIKLRERLQLIKFIEIILYIALLVIGVMALNNQVLKSQMSYRQGEIDVLEYWIKDASGYCNNGIGPAIFFVGLGVAVLSKVGVYIFYFISNVKESLSDK